MLSRLYTPLLVLIATSSTIAFGVAIANDSEFPIFEFVAVLMVPIAIVEALVILAARRWAVAECIPQLFLWFVASGMLLYFLFIGIGDPVQMSWGPICDNNLKQIGVALHNYHEEYGCFPPAIIMNHGRPMHSWRVLLLPYLGPECASMYKNYDFTEPWDGPNNKRLLDRTPREYVCPADGYACRHGNRPAGCTSYVAVIGGSAAWQGDRSLTQRDLRDGTDRSVLVVDAANSDIAWTEPKDLSWDEVRTKFQSSSAVALFSKHWYPHGFFLHNSPGLYVHGLLADGSACHIPSRGPTPELIETSLAAGGYDRDKLQSYAGSFSALGAINWWNCYVFAIWAGSAYALLCRAVRSRNKPPAPAADNAN